MLSQKTLSYGMFDCELGFDSQEWISSNQPLRGHVQMMAARDLSQVRWGHPLDMDVRSCDVEFSSLLGAQLHSCESK